MKTIQQRIINRYSISFKQMVVKEIEQGICIEQARKKYDIKGSHTIQQWITTFGKNHLLNKIVRIETMDERSKIKQLEEDNKKLKMALADAYMAKECLEGLIDMANKEYKTDLKKNFGDHLPNNLKGNTK